MSAKPTVEPIPRCALSIPEAIPARSSGTVSIAMAVEAGTHWPSPAPMMKRPTGTRTTVVPITTTSTTRPSVTSARPVTAGLRGPTRAAQRPSA